MIKINGTQEDSKSINPKPIAAEEKISIRLSKCKRSNFQLFNLLAALNKSTRYVFVTPSLSSLLLLQLTLTPTRVWDSAPSSQTQQKKRKKKTRLTHVCIEFWILGDVCLLSRKGWNPYKRVILKFRGHEV